MKLNDYKKTYQDYSGKASDVARQLSFAGIAIIWIFKVQSQSALKIPNGLLIPLVLFCVSLAFDLSHYLLGYVIWYFYYRYLENKATDPNEELKHDKFLPFPMHLCMWIKVLAVVIAYYYLAKFIIYRLMV